MTSFSIKVILVVCVIFTFFGSTSCSSTNKASTSSNSTSQEKDDEYVFTIVEQSATYPHGFGTYGFTESEYVSKNLRYPKEAKRLKIEGEVLVRLTLTKEGYVENTEIVKGIGGGCDEEAIRLVNESGRWQPQIKWNPETEKGELVKSKITIPVVFKLDKTKE
jgi:protein TonB